MRSWTASATERLDAFLAREAGMVSRNAAQRAIENGHIAVNGTQTLKPAQRLKEGDTVAWDEVDERTNGRPIAPADLFLPILYEDSHCIVINKPAGIAVHPGNGMDEREVTILNGIAHLLTERGRGFSPDATLVHRIDRETTGCLLVALTPSDHHALQKQFEERKVRKHYLALVAGLPSFASAVIDAPIGRHHLDRTKMSVMAASGVRDARTTYRTLGSSPTKDSTLFLCELHTGRTHQIRVHLHSIGHPILGDTDYSTATSERLSRHYGVRSLCLHAWSLQFTSPGGAPVAVTAPLPATLTAALKATMIALPSPLTDAA